MSLYRLCWLRPQGIPRRGTAARRAGQYCAWRAAAGGDFCGKINPAPAALCAGIGAVCTRRGKSVPPPLLRFASFGAFQRMRPPGARAGVAPVPGRATSYKRGPVPHTRPNKFCPSATAGVPPVPGRAISCKRGAVCAMRPFFSRTALRLVPRFKDHPRHRGEENGGGNASRGGG